MSDAIKHECGISLIRLLKPLEYYKEKYGTAFYGVNKMYLMMEKQHNRGQDGAGFCKHQNRYECRGAVHEQGAFSQTTANSGYFCPNQ